MADLVTSQILINGAMNLIVKLTGVSDGTGETLVKKIDTTAFNPSPGRHLTVRSIEGNVRGQTVMLYWEATVPYTIVQVSDQVERDYRKIGGLTTPNVAGLTGSILLSTQAGQAGATYDITLHLRKNI